MNSSKRHSLHAVELSQRSGKPLCKLCRPLLPPAIGPDLPFCWASRPCGLAGRLTILLIKAGDVETDLGPTTTHKQVWICYIYHRQIHGRKQISIRCNRIEHSVSAEHNTQDTLTCHLHKESRLTIHIDITPQHSPRPITHFPQYHR